MVEENESEVPRVGGEFEYSLMVVSITRGANDAAGASVENMVVCFIRWRSRS